MLLNCIGPFYYCHISFLDMKIYICIEHHKQLPNYGPMSGSFGTVNMERQTLFISSCFFLIAGMPVGEGVIVILPVVVSDRTTINCLLTLFLDHNILRWFILKQESVTKNSCARRNNYFSYQRSFAISNVIPHGRGNLFNSLCVGCRFFFRIT
jgi:hypothetical protein